MVLGEHLGLMLIGRFHRNQIILLVDSVVFCFRFTLAKYDHRSYLARVRRKQKITELTNRII